MTFVQLKFTFNQILKNFPTFRSEPKIDLLSEDVLKEIWLALSNSYFTNQEDLSQYTIKWSNRRQKRSLASCNSQKKTISVAKALSNPKCLELLEPLLYHEMCHAVLGQPKKINGRYRYHGKEFKSLEKRHPKIKQLNLWIKSGGWSNAKRVFTRLSNQRKKQI